MSNVRRRDLLTGTALDTQGDEWEQPADLVILSAYTIFNVQLLHSSASDARLRVLRALRRNTT